MASVNESLGCPKLHGIKPETIQEFSKNFHEALPELSKAFGMDLSRIILAKSGQSL